MTDYAKSAASANKMLKKTGGPVTLRRTIPGAYDPDTGAMGAAIVTDYVGTGAKFDYSAHAIDGTLIQSGDQQLYLSVKLANGQAMPLPTITDTVLIGASVFSVASVGKIEPADIPVLFILQIRGL